MNCAILWPNDKNIQINKLDTHLTNLKSFLYEKINFSIKISFKGQYKFRY